jgi:hypothetical protein
MSVKVGYYRTVRSDSLVTAVWDDVSQFWSVQLLLPEKVRMFAHLLLGKAGFTQVGQRAPKYKGDKDVQVGTSGQRLLFRNGRFHAEYWSPMMENGTAWGGTLLLWGRHLGQLFGLLRKLIEEPVQKMQEVETGIWTRTLPVSYIRPPKHESGQTLADRIASICTDGLLAWNIRLALYRMRKIGQPIGDQMSVDCDTGGYRYSFFNEGRGGCFSAEPVAVVPRAGVLRRGSIRSYHTDSGAYYASSKINPDERASTLLAPNGRNGEGVREVLVLGQIRPADLIFMVERYLWGTGTEKINEICQQHGVECHVGDMSFIYGTLAQQILSRRA